VFLGNYHILMLEMDLWLIAFTTCILAHLYVALLHYLDDISCFLSLQKRLVRLWFDHEHRHEEWSISTRLHQLQLVFRRLRLPSTTCRFPRSLVSYKKFKANEMRVLLLFGHVIFKNVLKKKYYMHLLKLVLMMHLSESRQVHHSYINTIKHLGQNFVIDFSKLYTNRHCVQVVHSLLHVSATVRDFGPLSNYTTFQFENELGRIHT
jgi:hypothetical protein